MDHGSGGEAVAAVIQSNWQRSAPAEINAVTSVLWLFGVYPFW
jgi:hypothetical protein